MKIKAIEALPFSIPYTVPINIATGTHLMQKSVLARITTEGGKVGLGETAPMPHFQGCNETQSTVVSVIRELYAPRLVGMSVFDIERANGAMESAIHGANYARAAVSDALHDAAARTLGIPLCHLLGGMVRDKIPAVWSIGRKPPQDMAQEARQRLDQGYFVLKCKIGAPDPETDIRNVAAIRDEIGLDVPFHVDGNAGMYYPHALLLLKRMVEPFRLRMVEQPVPFWDIAGLAKLGQDLRIPIMADESACSLQATLELAQQRAVSMIDIKLAKMGGIHQARKIAAISEAAGILLYAGSRPATSIGTAAAAHFFAATSNVVEGDFTVGVDGWLAADIVRNPVQVREGYGIVPLEGPGIGVELDEQLLERWIAK